MKKFTILTFTGLFLFSSHWCGATSCEELFPNEPKNRQTCIDNQNSRGRLKNLSPDEQADLVRAHEQENRVNGLVRTTWKAIPNSLTELLNGGWQIASFAPLLDNWTVSTYGYPVSAAVAVPGNTGTMFLLTKAGKYATCTVIEQPRGGAQSVCRGLN